MRWIIGLLFGLGCATLVASPLDGWLLPGEDVRRVGVLPPGIVCASTRTASGDAEILSWRLTNEGQAAARIDEAAFGVCFPFDCVLAGPRHADKRCAIWHVWCGGELAWLYARRPNGAAPYLCVNLVSGSVGSYSIDCDATLAATGAHYRGSPVLHFPPLTLAPGAATSLVFRVETTAKRPDRDVMDFPRAAVVEVSPRSPFVGEPVTVAVKTAAGEQRETKVFGRPGERIVPVEANGRRTFVRVNVLRDLRDILLTRARFIIDRQQCRKAGDPAEGAYVIYDRATGAQVCEPNVNDHNAARERLGMGCVVAMAARLSSAPEFRASLTRHRAFVEREIFDVRTGEVFNNVGRDNRWNRRYNYPWMAAYWIEWYRLSGEIDCLRHAVRTMDFYYRLNGASQESHGSFLPELAELCDKAGLTDEARRTRGHLLAQADNILGRAGKSVSGEVALTGAMPAMRIVFLAQAYLQSGEPKYLVAARRDVPQLEAYLARQPDCCSGLQNPRYWDGYWFGKSRLYGDTMPQWCGAVVGEAGHWLAKASGEQHFAELAHENLRGQLAAFFPDGFASCAGFTFKTARYRQGLGPFKPFMTPGLYPGERWDDWANDQDWSLYYAVRYLCREI